MPQYKPEPASQAQKGYLDGLGVEYDADISKDEASEAIQYALEQIPATPKQVAWLKKHNIPVPQGLCKSDAIELITENRPKIPATEGQLRYLATLVDEVPEGLSLASAGDLIEEARHAKPATAKQRQMIIGLGHVVPDGLSLAAASDMIEEIKGSGDKEPSPQNQELDAALTRDAKPTKVVTQSQAIQNASPAKKEQHRTYKWRPKTDDGQGTLTQEDEEQPF